MKVFVLAGGGGTRLWPLSTDENPKQFIVLPGMKQSLFQITLKRAFSLCNTSDIFILTSKKYRQLVHDQAHEINIALNPSQVFLEPKRLNTLPAMLAGLIYCNATGSDDVLVLPSDHILEDEASLISALKSVQPFLGNYLAIFGVKPTYAHVGYGYIKPDFSQRSDVHNVLEFKEKPDSATATRYVLQGYLWNSGILYFRYACLKKIIQEHQAELFNHFVNAADLYHAFSTWATAISIDNGLLEKTKSIIVSKISCRWIDIGSFDSLVDYLRLKGEHLQQLDESGSVLITEDSVQTVTLGVDDLIIVHTKNGHLICKRGQSALIKQLDSKGE